MTVCILASLFPLQNLCSREELKNWDFSHGENWICYPLKALPQLTSVITDLTVFLPASSLLVASLPQCYYIYMNLSKMLRPLLRFNLFWEGYKITNILSCRSTKYCKDLFIDVQEIFIKKVTLGFKSIGVSQ